jgi:hypothetical protein
VWVSVFVALDLDKAHIEILNVKESFYSQLLYHDFG